MKKYTIHMIGRGGNRISLHFNKDCLQQALTIDLSSKNVRNTQSFHNLNVGDDLWIEGTHKDPLKDIHDINRLDRMYLEHTYEREATLLYTKNP